MKIFGCKTWEQAEKPSDLYEDTQKPSLNMCEVLDEERYQTLQQRNAKKWVGAILLMLTCEVNAEGEGNNVEALDDSNKGSNESNDKVNAVNGKDAYYVLYIELL